MNPLVSIIIPTYSRPENLSRAIDSVLSQTYSPIEIIVVDDNGIGTDSQIETEHYLKPYIEKNQILYIKHEINKNGSAARNTGVKVAKGKIIGLMDDDDEFLPTKIEKQVYALENANKIDSKYKGCYCNLVLICDKIRKKPKFNKHSENLAEDMLLVKSWFNSSTLLFYKDAYNSINGFDERFFRHQDWEFVIRFLDNYKMELANPLEILVKKHRGNENGNVIANNPLRFIEIKQFFLSEMKPYINKLPHPEKIFHYQWLDLVKGLFRAGLFNYGWKYIKYAKRYGKLTVNEIFSLIYACIIYYTKKTLKLLRFHN